MSLYQNRPPYFNKNGKRAQMLRSLSAPRKRKTFAPGDYVQISYGALTPPLLADNMSLVKKVLSACGKINEKHLQTHKKENSEKKS